jgi:hypothetical protein
MFSVVLLLSFTDGAEESSGAGYLCRRIRVRVPMHAKKGCEPYLHMCHMEKRNMI